VVIDWGSRSTQALRFKVLSQIGCREGCSILDVRCGLGDLLAYMDGLGIRLKYTGYDITPAMIREAKRRFPGVHLEVGDLMTGTEPGESFDYVLAGGIFYLRQEEPLVYLDGMVRRMFAFCSRGVAFNTLSGRAPKRNEGEFYPDPCQVLEICSKITPWVVLRHDYLPNDFTIYLYKNPDDRQYQST
jgi:SAM-dependent methyltransferase